MSGLILFDPLHRRRLLPFAFTKPVAEFRIGILTIREKWEKSLNLKSSWYTETYLREKFPFKPTGDDLYINAAYCPTADLIGSIETLAPQASLFGKNGLIAFRGDEPLFKKLNRSEAIPDSNHFSGEISVLNSVWDIFLNNEREMLSDFRLVTANRPSMEPGSHCFFTGQDIFIEAGAQVEGCWINSLSGPVYIGANAEVMQGSMIRGPFSLGHHSTLKMGAKIYGATTIGPHCKVGGEVNNSVIFGYSNKAHDGFLGNSVIGEWCNLGADTNNSNLKNNYDMVGIWDFDSKTFISSGLQFCGLFMGDHSKSAINTQFNTGTVTGVSSNIFGAGFPRTYIPSFAWGGASKMQPYRLDKAMETAARVMERRAIELIVADRNILTWLFENEERQS